MKILAELIYEHGHDFLQIFNSEYLQKSQKVVAVFTKFLIN